MTVFRRSITTAFRRSRTTKTFPSTQTQCRSATSFAELYRNSTESSPVSPGDILQGHIVGARNPRSSTSRFYVVDFGLKSEAPFSGKEIPGKSQVGDCVSMPLLAIEDDFNEPVFDHDGHTSLPVIQAERYRLLTSNSSKPIPRLLHGRFADFNRGGAIVKVLGTDAFVPRHHVVALNSPILGTFAPFFLLSMTAQRASAGSSSLDVNPILSSYGGFLFVLAELVGSYTAWRKSGGGSTQERIAYLRLLTRLLQHKNVAVRRMLPRGAVPNDNRRKDHSERSPRGRDARRADVSHGDLAWLNALPHEKWVSSGRQMESGVIGGPTSGGSGKRSRLRRQSEPQTGVAVSPVRKK